MKKGDMLIQEKMKPAWKTTEFWFKVGAAAVSLVASFGLLTADSAKEFNDTWAELVNKVFDMAPLLIPVWLSIMHGKRRSEIKRTQIMADSKMPIKGSVPPKAGGVE